MKTKSKIVLWTQLFIYRKIFCSNPKRTAVEEYEAVVQLLIERDDTEIYVKTNYGNTPLPQAAHNGHEDVVQLDMRRRQGVELRVEVV